MIPTEFKVGVVMPYAGGRDDNLRRSLACLRELTFDCAPVVVVCDGCDYPLTGEVDDVLVVEMPKHQPGFEQPRNVGVRTLHDTYPGIDYVWFLDSDIIVQPNCLDYYREAWTLVVRVRARVDSSIFYGPYDWMAPGATEPQPELYNDPRWGMFEERNHAPVAGELGTALGCFSGNLVWPIKEFIEVGGFHPQLHAGRCEDGELGLRAASHKVPITCVKEARGWHVYHDIDAQATLAKNSRDVPLINQWHPWVETKGLVVTEADGARFEFVCRCGAQVNTLEMWQHEAEHTRGQLILDAAGGPLSDEDLGLILPDGMGDAPPAETWIDEFKRRQQQGVEDHIRAIIENDHWDIQDLSMYTGMTAEFIQVALERSQFRSHEG